jgi:hypothetical protein
VSSRVEFRDGPTGIVPVVDGIELTTLGGGGWAGLNVFEARIVARMLQAGSRLRSSTTPTSSLRRVSRSRAHQAGTAIRRSPCRCVSREATSPRWTRGTWGLSEIERAFRSPHAAVAGESVARLCTFESRVATLGIRSPGQLVIEGSSSIERSTTELSVSCLSSSARLPGS